MYRIDVAFIALQIIAVVENFCNGALLCRHVKKLIVRQQRRLARSHIGENHTGGLSAGMRPMLDLMSVCASAWLAGLLDDPAANIIEPAVINTPEAAVF